MLHILGCETDLLHLFQACSLDKYKSKEEKLQLLDDAISSNDGNAIINVSNFDSCVCHVP
jgi:hypothetical protein